jgi:hypothetical protein
MAAGLGWVRAMTLREAIDKYLEAAGGYGKSVALAALGGSHEETERSFSIFDEDYHISRFIHLGNHSGEKFQINGFPQTHLSVDAEIESIL